MELADRVIVAAPPARVWAVWADVERWPEWTASVTRIEPLSGPLGPGARFRIAQPRLAVLVWEVTAYDAGVSWAWVARSAGATTTGFHAVRAEGDGTVADMRIVHEGWLGRPVGWLLAGLTRRYMALEGAGLKRVAEER